MVKNSTNINKTNKHLSPSLTEHKKTSTYDVWNPGLAWDRHINVAGLNRFIVSQPSPFDNWIHKYREAY
jgi:hypothetical protein